MILDVQTWVFSSKSWILASGCPNLGFHIQILELDFLLGIHISHSLHRLALYGAVYFREEGICFGPELPPPVVGVLEAGPAVVTSTLSPTAAVFIPGKVPRVVVARSSRERSPHGTRALPSSASPSSSSHNVPTPVSAGTTSFTVGQAVALVDLVFRTDLVGKCDVVKSFDSTSLRYAVCIDVSGETVRVLGGNLKPSIFASGFGFG